MRLRPNTNVLTDRYAFSHPDGDGDSDSGSACPDRNAGADPHTYPNCNSHAGADGNPRSGAHCHTCPHSDAHAEADGDSDRGAHAHADSRPVGIA